MLRKIKKIILAATALAVLTPALAIAMPPTASAACTTAACEIQGGVTAGGGVDSGTASTNVHKTLTQVVDIFSLIVGIIAVIVIIIAGLTYITSGGNEQKVASAKSTIVYVVVGLIIVAFAQVIVRVAIHTGK